MSSRLYLDVHILQTVPPANLNRDDTGSPKSAIYGGVRRSRVSSQSWKRATRQIFADELPKADQATRTKRMQALLANRLAAKFNLPDPAATNLSEALVSQLGIKAGAKKGDTSYLLFFGYQQLDAIADLVADRISELAALQGDALAEAVKDLPVKEQLGSGHPLDVALFGRMVADVKGLNVDAAVQVAHALSTHAAAVEFDYFTAVDDENAADESGAGMIGTVEFNSATLYRYATVGLHQLRDNLADTAAAVDALDLFTDAFARSMPTGHQNTFAHRTLPHLVIASLREDQPVNLVSAFERPVRTADGIAEASMYRLADEHKAVTANWCKAPRLLAATGHTTDPKTEAALADAFGPLVTFAELREKIRQEATAWYAKEAS
ncbi:type I-E CRISPR-associated protein Cas7/Cse4/CasC [Catenulispora sp. NL8]|uniref:Type I-E CRISPR-associated protein Cas7/Cse4/CasC n=1 Tax=Catenulispora pinistramenti TaxID=2705254 RepID=A0ABS5KH33_9ACTN|nr:type I-E CRISPR-associated protein Cas7/Cse4/CasC [Catenulispora pinistramenti]MBS2545347.1 type I-E CRISPR-associated protein Cas7/Cse4/CasC [Catenulispora pinistramenti]